MTKLIAAMDPNGVIGKDNKLPWKIKEDLQFFKETTMGGFLVMGRKTWDSMGRKSLPGRYNLVVTSQYNLAGDQDTLLYEDIDTALATASAISHGKTFVIGGASIYEQVLEKGLVRSAIISHILTEYDGDAKFPIKYLENCPRTLIREYPEFHVYEYYLRQ